MPTRVPLFVIELANDRDPVLTEPAVARLDLKSFRLHITRGVADRLKLPLERGIAVRVRIPAGREDVDMAKDCRLTICGRTEVFRAVVDPDAEVCTVGFGPLGLLDLIPDRRTGMPVPRDQNEMMFDV